jgi:hypothetical protein
VNEFIIIIHFAFKDHGHLKRAFSLEKKCHLWEAALAAGNQRYALIAFGVVGKEHRAESIEQISSPIS